MKHWIQLSAKVGGLYGHCGGNCEAILRFTAINAARSHGVPFVIWGSSAIESGNWAGYLSVGKQGAGAAMRARLKNAASRLTSLVKNMDKVRKIPALIYSHVGYHAIMFSLTSISQRLRLGFPYSYALRPRSVPPFTQENPRVLQFYDYVSWDSISNTDILRQELKWEHPEGRPSRFDCLIHSLGNQENLHWYGISADGAVLCKFVREGKMDKETARKGEEMIAASVDEEVEEVLEKVGLKGYKGLPIRQTKYGAF
jgi:hypothetical protein